MQDDPEDNLSVYRARMMPGSCQWLRRRESFLDWTHPSNEAPRIYWLYGLPATGKSTLATYTVDYLQHGFMEESCQYHFFSYGDQTKRTATHFLLSIALQIAQTHNVFADELLSLYEESGISMGSQKLHTLWENVFEGILFRLDLGHVLHWVVDALDECESPLVLIDLFLKIRSRTPIKIFLTSRSTKDLSTIGASRPSHIMTETISLEDTSDDIRACVEAKVSEAIPNEKVRLDVTNQVFKKASGSFLWVRLAMESLRANWHTQEDIQSVLNLVPDGMEFLYEQMFSHVLDQKERIRDMAVQILTWATCSFRPLRISELQVALEPRFGSFVSLEDTIVQICGQFVRIDPGVSTVSLIHATARQFLSTATTDRKAFIDNEKAHEDLAKICIGHLSRDTWRQVLARVPEKAEATSVPKRQDRLCQLKDTHPLLDYATKHWAYHVSHSSTVSSDLVHMVSSLLDKWALSWIHAVALSGNIRTLILTAQYIRAYLKRRKSRASTGPLQSLRQEVDTKAIQAWATDMIRIVGKFGLNIVQVPSSIYRQVAPFCPKDSMISRCYAKPREMAFSVRGISSAVWDDCLARLSVGEDHIASKVLCTSTLFITLISNGGVIIFWFADTCEEARRVRHGEYVTNMVLNKAGTMLATVGFQTFRIWETSSGKELFSFPRFSLSIPIAITFGTVDTELLIATDDCLVSCYDLVAREVTWRFLAEETLDKTHSCPRLMVFSPDNSKVAIAFRGRPVLIWDITLPQDQTPQRCIRTEDRDRISDDVYNCPEVVCWKPQGTSLLILYQDTYMVDWNIDDDEQIQYSHVEGREMVISHDGNLLLTSDAYGSLSVWTFPNLKLMYRLFYDEFVRDLAFSPDAQRIYDVRGSLCNVWEPDALVRPDDLDSEEQSSAHDSATSEPITSRDDNARTQITALTCDIDDKYYCCGREDGTVAIHEMEEGKRIRRVHNHAKTSAIIALAWSPSGRFLASGDDSGRVIVKRLELKGPGTWAVFGVLDTRIVDNVQQFLFSPDERHFLISTQSWDRLWDVKTKTEVKRQRKNSRSGNRWTNHPSEDMLVLISPKEVSTHSWSTLERMVETAPAFTGSTEDSQTTLETSVSTILPTMESDYPNFSEPSESVSWISHTSNRRNIIFETLPHTGHARSESVRGLRLEYIMTSDINTSGEPIKRYDMGSLADEIARLIGCYGNKVVFLNRQYWICTWDIGAAVNTLKQHFFLPRDWLAPSTLSLALMNSKGSFLCTKNGEVAIVRNGIKH